MSVLMSLVTPSFQNTKTQTVVKLTVVPCAPVVEVKIKRPETKYQLGFSVQNGVVSLFDPFHYLLQNTIYCQDDFLIFFPFVLRYAAY